MIYMLFALGLCRDKHVNRCSFYHNYWTAMYCSKISKHETETKWLWVLKLFNLPCCFCFLVFWPTVMMNINKLILYYQQEKLINNVSPGNLLVFLCETKFYLLCFLSHFKSFSFLYIQSRGQERALALAIQKLTTAISPGSLAWCLACS